jgi:hypothetical protein
VGAWRPSRPLPNGLPTKKPRTGYHPAEAGLPVGPVRSPVRAERRLAPPDPRRSAPPVEAHEDKTPALDCAPARALLLVFAPGANLPGEQRALKSVSTQDLGSSAACGHAAFMSL